MYFGVLIEEVFPKAVYGLFGIFGGRYDPLKLDLDFTGLYVICIAAFAVGVSAVIWAYRAEKKRKIMKGSVGSGVVPKEERRSAVILLHYLPE